jgi:hypothetical protein
LWELRQTEKRLYLIRIAFSVERNSEVLMKMGLSIYLWIILLGLLLSACNLGVKAPPEGAATLDPLYTAAAQTLGAMATQAAPTPSSALATSTPFPGENSTATPTSTLFIATSTLYFSPAPVKHCDAAAFVKDVTIPDDSVLSPGSAFTKTWRLQNTGTCTWTSSYALVFISGDSMNAPAFVNLPGNVNPGDTVDLSVKLVAPPKKGQYRGNWKLRNASGILFGIGTQADTPFWVDITVIGPEFAAYDFVDKACEAEWKSNSGSLPCPGIQDDDDGYVLKLSKPRMENGAKVNQPGLLTTPRHTKNGFIQGMYPVIKVQEGDHFVTSVNCQYNANTCDVLFQVKYQVGDGPIKTLKEWHEVYEGKYTSVDLDLSSLAGKNVRFYLIVSANASKGKDQALWLAPRILRQGTPPPTSTATYTPTVTVTATSTPSPTPTETPTETTVP